MCDRRVAYGRGLGILEHALNFFGTRIKDGNFVSLGKFFVLAKINLNL